MKKNIVFLLIIWMLFFTSCSQNTDAITGKFEILSGNPTVTMENASTIVKMKRGDSILLKYDNDVNKINSFYSVSFDITLSGDCDMFLMGGRYDINGESVTKTLSNSRNRRIVMSNNNSSVEFNLCLQGNNDCEVNIDNLTISDAENDNYYSIFSSSSDKIDIIFNKDDVKESKIKDTEIIKWLDCLDELRETASQFSQNELEHINICATEEFSHYGLAGNPIYICQNYVVDDLSRISQTINLTKEKRDILWRYCHEICHVADGFGCDEIANRVFDSEFSAQIECVYCMYTCGYRYDGELLAVDYFSNSIPLENKIFTDEGFLYKILQILQENNIPLSCLKNVFTSNQYEKSMNKKEKLDVFFDVLSESAGFDIRKNMTDSELSLILTKYKEN